MHISPNEQTRGRGLSSITHTQSPDYDSFSMRTARRSQERHGSPAHLFTATSRLVYSEPYATVGSSRDADDARALLVVVDQRIRRRVVRADRAALFAELRQNDVCELLAELDAPLVEGVDVPDDALGKEVGGERVEEEVVATRTL